MQPKRQKECMRERGGRKGEGVGEILKERGSNIEFLHKIHGVRNPWQTMQ